MSQMPMKSVLFSISVTNVCRSASASRCRVTSRAIFDAATTFPSASVIGEMVSDTQISRPLAVTAFGLEVIDPASRLQAGDDLVLLGDALGRNDRARCAGPIASDAG